MIKEYIEDQLEASEYLLEAAEQAKDYVEAFRHEVRIRLLKDLMSEGVNLNIPDVMPLFSLTEIETRLRTQIENNIGEDEHSTNWENKEGVLISNNDALVLLRLLENKA